MTARDRQDDRVDVAILGPTGMVGQQFVRQLADHPWFRLVEVVGSERSAGRTYGEAVDWAVGGTPPEAVAGMEIGRSGMDLEAPIVFSALPGDAARRREVEYRDRGHAVFTNASAHRFTEDRVPIVPEVNGSRLHDLLGSGTGSGRGIVPNPNCVVAGLAIPLAAIDDAFGLTSITVTTLQALSGAGLTGVSALEGLGNVIPDIPGEGPKIARETKAILGVEVPMSVDVHRVPVHTGHLASVRVRTRQRPGPDEVVAVLSSFRGRAAIPSVPTAPATLVRVHDASTRPQPARDVDEGRGMTVSVGRVASDEMYHVTFSLLVHNTIRGAAGGSVLNAELALARGLLGSGTATQLWSRAEGTRMQHVG